MIDQFEKGRQDFRKGREFYTCLPKEWQRGWLFEHVKKENEKGS